MIKTVVGPATEWRYGAFMRTPFSVADFFQGDMDEARLASWASQLRARLPAPSVDLGVVFLSPRWSSRAQDILDVLRVHARIPRLVGCSAHGAVSNGREHEEMDGLVLALHHLPGATLDVVHVAADALTGDDAVMPWSGLASSCRGALAFADPFQTHNEGWLAAWNRDLPSVPVVGGLASGLGTSDTSQIYRDGEVHEDGVVMVFVGGAFSVVPMVSQGCTPIGDPWTITRAERNVIFGIANRPAYSVLVDTFNAMSAEERQRAQNNLMVGFASAEDRPEHGAGEFLVRNLLGVDPRHGALAVGAMARPGQTVQFQRRDADAASADLSRCLERTRGVLAGRKPVGGVLFSCCGRGQGLFGKPDHDATLIQEHLGPLALSGLFANGEIGPVGSSCHLHGYTASLALFVRD